MEKQPPIKPSGISDIEVQQMMENCHRTEAHIWNAMQSKEFTRIPLCQKKHVLNMVMESAYHDDEGSNDSIIEALCDKCDGQIKAGCWKCVQCQYDLCFECETYIRTLCNKRHPMKPVTQEHLINFEPSCRICVNKIYLACYAVYCDVCNYDICGNCFVKPISISAGKSILPSAKK